MLRPINKVRSYEPVLRKFYDNKNGSWYVPFNEINDEVCDALKEGLSKDLIILSVASDEYDSENNMLFDDNTNCYVIYRRDNDNLSILDTELSSHSSYRLKRYLGLGSTSELEQKCLTYFLNADFMDRVDRFLFNNRIKSGEDRDLYVGAIIENGVFTFKEYMW